MVEQPHVTEYLLNIGQQIANAQTAEQRDRIAETVLGSQRLANALDHVDDERVHDKMQSAAKSLHIQDKVHISEEAQALYHEHGADMTALSEKVHDRHQEPPEEPVRPKGALGPMEAET